ncbi:MAG TPA: hypothetical protein PLZ53_04125 [Candidatus Hydrogenedentes bacterium]|jgi:phage FluMu protein Com|nr:MAG: hypothetical protein BWY07_01624 [Candidatus Hydrogenedentes bacterium ADurb.Bin170]HNZ48125.1 hypothetical protein [Candidatus Hydrogenedentota bacterium]HOH42279.1 hypothetical protein [Candidatus Hydrogenedentota bacterium]HOM47757.1 hypothetical protein [Candidatus Hydrogenedentota bacterium]HPX86516.1 hypothetical protein [Candidatus Hydrogenedentota bacterium]
MIQITLGTALLVYGTVIIVGFALLSLLGELRATGVYTVLEKQFMWRCVFCSFLYLDQEAVTISRCPRCGSYNKSKEAQDERVSANREHWAPEPVSGPADPEDLPRRNPSRRKRPGQSRRGPRRRR